MLVSSLSAALFPEVCVACGLLLRRPAPSVAAKPDPGRPPPSPCPLRGTPLQLPLCSRCAPEVTPLAPDERTVDGVVALFAYDGPLAAAISRLKFAGAAALAGPLARLLATAPELADDPTSGACPWDLLAPIPLHPLRAMRRGYNQAALLAAWLARAWPGEQAPELRQRLLRRTRPARPQTELDREGRQHNLRGAFAVRALSPVEGLRVLLVDDVTTTGSTLAAGRRALLSAGAAEVCGLALLRALP